MAIQDKNTNDVLLYARDYIRKYKSADDIEEKIDLIALLTLLSLAVSISDENGAASRLVKEVRILANALKSQNSVKSNKNDQQ